MSAEPAILHLSLVVGGDLLDADGARLGKVDDLLVRLGGEGYPPVSGAVATVAGRPVFVPADRIAGIEPGRVRLSASRLDVQPFRRRPDEVLLRHDLLDRQLVNVDGARIVRANEIEIARIDGWWRVAGVDTGMRGLARRLLPRALAARVRTATFLDWATLEPFTGHIPTIQLKVPHPKLARLHPAELADLLEAAPRGIGEEIAAVVGQDPELEADVFEELGAAHQAELLDDRSDAEIAELVARMEADDATDLLATLPDERRIDVLALVPATARRRLRTLLGYEPTTAGGLMSPELATVFAQATAGEALERVRRAAAPREALAWVFVVNAHHRYRGAVALSDLVRADPETPVVDLVAHQRSLAPDAPLETIVRMMTDFDLVVVPVLDGEQRPLGIVTVDDVLELVAPPPGRRPGIFGEG